MNEVARITHRLIIKIPGEEKLHTSFHPSETFAREHLDARLKGIPGVPVGIPPLPPGSEWWLYAMVEELITKGKVLLPPPK